MYDCCLVSCDLLDRWFAYINRGGWDMSQEKNDLPLTIAGLIVVLSIVGVSYVDAFHLFRQRLFDEFMLWGGVNIPNMEHVVHLSAVLLVALLVADFGFSLWARWLTGLSALVLALTFSVLVFVQFCAGGLRPVRVAVFVSLVGPFVVWGFLRWYGRLRRLKVKQARGVNPPTRRADGLYIFGWFWDVVDRYVQVGRFRRRLLPKVTRRFAVRSRAPLLLPVDRLSRPSAVVGWQGAGKTFLMFDIYERLAELYPGLPVLIHDPKGDWAARYYDPATDLIFAPYARGSTGWKLWDDFHAMPEIVTPVIETAVSCYSEGAKEKIWGNKAAEYIEQATKEPTLDAALAFLLLKRQQHGKDEMFKSIFHNVTKAFSDIAAVELLQSEQRLSMAEFLQHPGRIFLLNTPVASKKQRGCFALFLSSFLLSALSRPDVPAGQLCCAAFIDEALLFTLPPDTERALYNQTRSKGIFLLNAAQRLPHRDAGESATWGVQSEYLFAFQCSDQDTARHLSAMAGKIIFEEPATAESYQADNVAATAATVSQTERHYDELPPEFFAGLRPREFVLFHSGGICPGKTGNVKARRSAAPFEFVYDPRSDLDALKDKLL